MGIYLNPQNESFKIDSSDELYIDKTGLLKELNKVIGTPRNCIALSHARRFGKSQAAGMIDAYYSVGFKSEELFSAFEIAQSADFKKHLNKYNVIHIDISAAFDFHKEDLVEYLTECICEDFRTQFSNSNTNIDYTKIISSVFNQAYRASGKRFVIILDEWDCVIRNQSNRPDLVHHYLEFLHAIFKSEESKNYLALAYITGILPIKKITDESALNNFMEYTMLSSKRFTKYFGFTDDEVKNLCKKYGMSFEAIQQWYDGYLIDGIHIYNPNSVIRAISEQALEAYWKNTSSFETINSLITLNMNGLRENILAMLSGDKISVNVNTFQNDLSIINTKDDALTALIHLGYLGYDLKWKKAFIPNFEVAKAYESALTIGKWKDIAATISRCNELLSATIEMNAEKVAELVELSHDAYSSILKYNDENSLSCAITMAYFTAQAYYTVIREFPSGKGFADIAMIPRADYNDMPAMIIELKWNHSADTAIRQIKERRYAGKLSGFSAEILLVGISYNKDSSDKKHDCIIERLSV